MVWGPVPALLLIPFKLVTKRIVPPGWIAVSAVMLAQCLLAASVLLITTPRGNTPAPFLTAVTLLTLGLSVGNLSACSELRVGGKREESMSHC